MDPMPSATFAERLRAAMEHRGLNANQLAVRSGRSPSYFSTAFARNTRTVTPDIARQIASALNVRVAWLMSGDGPMVGDEGHHDGAAASPAPPPVSDTYVANDIVDGLVNAAFDPTRHMASDIIPVVEALKETAALMGDYLDHAAYARYLLDAQAAARESGKRISPRELPFAALGVSHQLRLKMQALVDQKMKDAEARILKDGGTVLPPGEIHPAVKRAQEIAKKKGQR